MLTEKKGSPYKEELSSILLAIVSDSLQHVPEKATIVTTYKCLVVRCEVLSSLVENYITYFVVHAGWENAQIAT
jgi:hypothetical protein